MTLNDLEQRIKHYETQGLARADAEALVDFEIQLAPYIIVDEADEFADADAEFYGKVSYQ